ncbi:conjugal transfer protein TraI [Olivibacter sp. 47]|uniref:conjugal transfer protein TraI n=1 Tax=Olivibacter sp. 47 TaxID=3056486 RepID=UPI0025A4C49F|nr:conjugal transfer protein TraI [Olivibacter sp. 47]MDM8175996.1 conjugal transfer protein TraI [Olivibacter sp. 47]
MDLIRKLFIGTALCVLVLFPRNTGAAVPAAILAVIQAGVKRVIKAVDLKIQREQNKIIWLQNAHKTIENTLSKLKLDEITDWTERQRTLYADYFDEMWKVKSAISYYGRVRDMVQLQVDMVNEYQRAWNLFRQDDHFSPDELSFMEEVYNGMLEQSVKNLDQVELVIQAFSTQMSDAKRLETINAAKEVMEENLSDLRQFNRGNTLLSLQRARDRGDIDRVKQLYGIKN